jgi:hypothetical protein
MAEFPKSFRQFTGEHAAVASACKALGEGCAKAGPLDERTRELVKLGIAGGGRLEGAVHSHARRPPGPRGRRQAAIDQGETVPAQAEGPEIARNLTRPPRNERAAERTRGVTDRSVTPPEELMELRGLEPRPTSFDGAIIGDSFRRNLTGWVGALQEVPWSPYGRRNAGDPTQRRAPRTNQIGSGLSPL